MNDEDTVRGLVDAARAEDKPMSDLLYDCNIDLIDAIDTFLELHQSRRGAELRRVLANMNAPGVAKLLGTIRRSLSNAAGTVM